VQLRRLVSPGPRGPGNNPRSLLPGAISFRIPNGEGAGSEAPHPDWAARCGLSPLRSPTADPFEALVRDVLAVAADVVDAAWNGERRDERARRVGDMPGGAVAQVRQLVACAGSVEEADAIRTFTTLVRPSSGSRRSTRWSTYALVFSPPPKDMHAPPAATDAVRRALADVRVGDAPFTIGGLEVGKEKPDRGSASMSSSTSSNSGAVRGTRVRRSR
jgi:hypothetical protein